MTSRVPLASRKGRRWRAALAPKPLVTVVSSYEGLKTLGVFTSPCIMQELIQG